MSRPELPLSQVSFEARKKWRNFQPTWKSPIKVIHEKFEKQKALMEKKPKPKQTPLYSGETLLIT